MRIVAIESSALWTGAIQERIYLDVPEVMDLQKEEDSWFAAGGGTPRDFANFLIAKGAQEFTTIETWNINYQS